MKTENDMGRACGIYLREINICRILMEKREGKRPIGRTRHKWQYTIKMGWEGMD